MHIIIGTVKGGWILGPKGMEGPIFKGWKVTAATRAKKWYAATASDVYGAAIHVSDDLKNWKQIEKGPAYAKDGPKMKQIWTLRPGTPMYAGVDEAGLFRSEDGKTWEPLKALHEHPTRSSWFPGAGGLCAHAVLADRKRIWCAISAVGVFRSDDGGKSWQTRDQGVQIVIEDKVHKDIGT
jgi:hypothetical protein